MRTIPLPVTVLVFLVLQAVVAGRVAFGEIAPDFVVMCVVLFGLQRGAVPGSVFGFVVGLLQDLGNPGYLGLNALTKSLLGFTAGKVGAAASAGTVVLSVVFFVAALGHDIVYLVLYKWPRLGSALVVIVTAALPSAVYTAVVGVLLERVLGLLGAKVVTSLGKER